jgi:hypothetical protein
MEKKLGAALGVLAAAAVVVVGVVTGVPAVDTVVRAVLAGAAGALMGWLLFGKLVAALRAERAETTEKKNGEGP